MTICVLVLNQEEKAYELWEKLQKNNAQITNFKVIEPPIKKNVTSIEDKKTRSYALPLKVEINDIKIFNPKISRKEKNPHWN